MKKEMQTDSLIQKKMPTSKANENLKPKLSYLVKEIDKGRYIPKSRGRGLILCNLSMSFETNLCACTYTIVKKINDS